MARSYIPSQDGQLKAWLINFAAVITATPGLYGLVAADAAAITAAKTAFVTAFDLLNTPATNTTPNVAAKDLAKATTLITVRTYAQLIQANAGVSNDAKAAAGLTVRATGRTPIAAPGTAPVLGLIGCTPGEVTMKYADTTTPTKKSKPFGAIQLEVFVAIALAPATDPSAANYHETQTKSPFTLTTQPADRGKFVTVWGRWQTRTGKNGPWSLPISVTAV